MVEKVRFKVIQDLTVYRLDYRLDKPTPSMTGSSLATLLITACQDSIFPGSRFVSVSFCDHSGLTTFEMFCVY